MAANSGKRCGTDRCLMRLILSPDADGDAAAAAATAVARQRDSVTGTDLIRLSDDVSARCLLLARDDDVDHPAHRGLKSRLPFSELHLKCGHRSGVLRSGWKLT